MRQHMSCLQDNRLTVVICWLVFGKESGEEDLWGGISSFTGCHGKI